MSYLATEVNRLQQAFETCDIKLGVEENYFFVKNSTEDKVRTVVESVGFSPIFSTQRAERVYFTIAPYEIPAFFKEHVFNPNDIVHSGMSGDLIKDRDGSGNLTGSMSIDGRSISMNSSTISANSSIFSMNRGVK
ncbi:hypothetical protein PHSC3_000074 [Chlamydiales bacterium STE3]|nr:hypothetical protein PHSC3_000074 [Chlamydiales bacterium STE3]